MKQDIKIQNRKLTFLSELYATLVLFFLCGWYFIILIAVPILMYFAVYGSILAGTILTILITLSIIPLDHTPNTKFMYSSYWKPLRDYFSFEYDVSTMKFVEGKKYMFFEQPHGIFPMGQFLSASLIEEMFPGKMVCGTGADAIFLFPCMRQIMSWLGTRPANRKSIKKILEAGHHVAIVTGGIAEMFLSSPEQECIYFKKRKNTIKAAIEEGCNIVPTFFFGNTKLFTIVGGKGGNNSWLSRLSRKLRISLVFFYGRFGLPIPFRHPIKMVSGEIIEVTQNSSPSAEEIDAVHEKVTQAVIRLYNSSKKPDWETRPLVII